MKDSDDDVIEDEDTATDVDDADTGHIDVMSTFGQHHMIRIYILIIIIVVLEQVNNQNNPHAYSTLLCVLPNFER